MVYLAYSPLTKRYYYLPLKGSKVDITEDIKEIISHSNKDIIDHLQQELSAVAIATQETGLTKEEKAHYKSVGKVLHDILQKILNT